MKKSLHILFVLLLFHCADWAPTSPYLEGYPGKYDFDVEMTEDSLRIFQSYEITIRQTGIDTFKTFRVEPDSVVCDSFFEQLLMKDSTDSTLYRSHLYFTNGYTGDITIVGVRPNEKTVLKKIPVSVENPYAIKGYGKLGVGDTEFYTIEPDSLIDMVVWNDTIIRDTLKTGLDSVGSFVVFATIADSFGNSIELDSIEVEVFGESPEIEYVVTNGTAKLGAMPVFAVKVTTEEDSLLFLINDDTVSAEIVDGSASIKTVQPINDTGTIVYSIVALSSDGLASNSKKVFITVSSVFPNPQFSSDTLFIPVGEPIVVSFFDDSRDEHTQYKLTSSILDTMIDTTAFLVSYENLGMDTIVIEGFGLYGFAGGSDTIIAMADEYSYVIKEVDFPTEIKVGEWNNFSVSVEENGEIVDTSKYSIVWNIEPENYDSIIIGDTLSLLFMDSVEAFALSVRAILTGDTTAPIAKTISVRTWKPECVFDVDSISAKAGDSVTLVISADDANADGDIVSTIIITSLADTIINNESAKISIIVPGIHYAYTWAIDDDGFVSDTDTLIFTVTSDRPYFQPVEQEISVYVYDSVVISVNGISENPNTPISSYFWDFDNDGLWDDTTVQSSYKVGFDNAGIDTIVVSCVNSIGEKSEFDHKAIITIDEGKPVVSGIHVGGLSDTSYFAVPFTLFWSGNDPNNNIDSAFILINDTIKHRFDVDPGDSSIENENYLITFSDTGDFILSVQLKDETGFVSDSFSLQKTFTVVPGRPVITNFRPDTSYINDTVRYAIDIDDNNVGNHSYQISFDNVNFSEWEVATSVNLSFTDTGWHKVYLKVKDITEFESALFIDSVYIDPGKPVVTAILDNDSIWIHDSLNAEINVRDDNSLLSWLYYDIAGIIDSVNISGYFEKDIIRPVAFNNEGEKIVKIWAVDIEGIVSDTVPSSLVVLLGAPEVSSVSLDKSVVYVNDSVQITVQASDVNDTLKRVSLDLVGDTAAEIVTNLSAPSITNSYSFAWPVSESGSQTLRVLVYDNDGIQSTVYDTTIMVELGAPEVDSISLDTVWVVDNNTYQVYGSDINGDIDSFEVSFDSGSTWIGSNTGSVDHGYDTSQWGEQLVYTRVMDDDSVWSSVSQLPVYVRLGRPVISLADFGDSIQIVPGTGGELDTMFYKWEAVSQTTVKINSTDTNGTLIKYYWDWDEGFIPDDSTDISELKYGIDTNDVHLIRAKTKDEDGLVTEELSFLVYPDAPPKAISITQDKLASVVNILWSGKDVHDGDLTEYRIIISQGSTVNDVDIEVDFTEGINYESGSSYGRDFMYVFSTGVSMAEYSYKIVARDQRGSIVESSQGGFFFP